MNAFASWAPMYAELLLAALIPVVLLVDLAAGGRRQTLTRAVALAGLVLVAWAGFEASNGEMFGASFVMDNLARLLKLAGTLLTGMAFVYATRDLKDAGALRGEYYLLGLFALLGVFVTASAGSLLTLYLGLELLALALYTLVALQRDSARAAEAAMKYFVLGAIGSGAMLYGISLLYGLSGSLLLGEIAAQGEAGAGSYVAAALVLAGVAFKLGAVPFHQWVPDAYQGPPLGVAVVLATVPKLAYFALIVRLMVDGLPVAQEQWNLLLIVMAVASLAIGTIVALSQTQAARLFAWAAIAHVGFLLLGVAAGGVGGLSAALFYTLVYILMAAGAFGVVIALERQNASLDSLRGLYRRHPGMALTMLAIMLSLIGIPPLAGFLAKWQILMVLVERGMIALAVVAVVFAVVAAYYYLRIIRLMFMEAPEEEGRVAPGWGASLLLGANGLALLVLGIWPNALLELCRAAFAG
ncbi:MAG: NADH-quinone oxidoreductase subunit N [Gammaproteobacteria bacterium]|nr:NADH-quinone oxidoreductase subunit N [Gammaproteobacteria bacterium]